MSAVESTHPHAVPRRIAWVTCRDLPEPDADEQPALDALRAAGFDAELAAWDDPSIDWSRFELAIIRSTWNYFHDPAAFEAWLGRASELTTLANPLAACLWNLHKGYLRELEAAGVAIVPTAWQARGEPVLDLAAVMDGRGWSSVVVKPTVSAASFGTRRFERSQAAEARAFLEELASRGDAMVQPYIEGVDGAGEHSIIWIAGEYTHAIRKSPRLAGDDESVSGELSVSVDQQQAADAVLAAIPGAARQNLLYARVDLMPAGERWLLSELELLEPSLFLMQSPSALARFVAACAQYPRVD